MNKKYFAIIAVLLITLSLMSCSKEALSVMKINTGSEFCDITKYTESYEDYDNSVIKFDFGDANLFFNKLNYNGDFTNEFYTHTIILKGRQIEISYVDDSGEESSMKTVSSYNDLPKKTLYIGTDMEYAMFSVPTVYDTERVFDSIQTIESLEKSITITHDEDTYYITYAFPKKQDVTAEFFYMTSGVPLVTIDSKTSDLLIRNELSSRFRFLEDGYYQVSYENYYPTGNGNYFRNCANYIGTHFIEYNNKLKESERVKLFDYFAYASTYIVDTQINENGYFETKSRSEWLYRDFLINNDFYDTRFNADNAELNILLFNRFSDKFFHDTLIKYGDFFVDYAKEHSYKTERGILVEDYYNPSGGLRTHVSLNHQLANLNVLLSLYSLTNDEKYFDTAKLMLYGIEDTEQEWILENSDLNYALHYYGTNNIMKDYPYLTYNDLYITKKRLEEVGMTSKTIDNLMKSKMTYMTSQGITGYIED